ncbi:MAG: DUF547 domain-containing protein [Litorimonas sp.]
MIKSKLFITSAIVAMSAVAANASACPCPDKPMPQNVLAPVIQTAELAVTPVTQKITQPAPALAAPVIANSTAAVQNEPAVVQLAQASEYGSGTTDTIADTPAAAYENLLGRRISKGAGDLNLFDYAGTKSSGEDKIVRDYIAYLSAQNPDAMNAAEATAYWANLYNAETVRLIIDNYPVKSIRKIGNGFTGPWKKNTLVVNGKDTSLDHIEHGILRKQFPSPYVHYMVNCASIGCPNLSTKLWKAETLEADQFAAAEAYINSPRGVAIQGNKLEISSIYKWFKDDFGGKSGLLPHFRKHARPELASVIDNGAKIDGYEYNWSLNE